MHHTPSHIPSFIVGVVSYSFTPPERLCAARLSEAATAFALVMDGVAPALFGKNSPLRSVWGKAMKRVFAAFHAVGCAPADGYVLTWCLRAVSPTAVDVVLFYLASSDYPHLECELERAISTGLEEDLNGDPPGSSPVRVRYCMLINVASGVQRHVKAFNTDRVQESVQDCTAAFATEIAQPDTCLDAGFFAYLGFQCHSEFCCCLLAILTSTTQRVAHIQPTAPHSPTPTQAWWGCAGGSWLPGRRRQCCSAVLLGLQTCASWSMAWLCALACGGVQRGLGPATRKCHPCCSTPPGYCSSCETSK